MIIFVIDKKSFKEVFIMSKKENSESFFLDNENVNHVNENYLEDAKSQKEHKNFHEQGEQESKENFNRIYYDTDRANVANQIFNKKNQYDGMDEETIRKAKYESGMYNQVVQNNYDNIVTAVTDVATFILKYNPMENKIQATKFILNLGHPDNKLNQKVRAQILKEQLGFEDKEIETIQKFEDYSSAVKNQDINRLHVNEFIQDNKNYFSLVTRKTGINQENQNMISRNFMQLLTVVQNNWNFDVFSSFYNGISHLYNTQMFNPLQEIDFKAFNRQTMIITSRLPHLNNLDIPNMRPLSTLESTMHDIDDGNRGF